MQFGIDELVTYLLYVARWVVLAIPGAGLLRLTCRIMSVWKCKDEPIVLAMLISQGLLGMVVYFVDRWIFR